MPYTESQMPSFQDSAVLVLIALLLFGPKGLAKLAREIGKLMGEFRRASNEFRMQMEDEFRISEQAEQQKKIAAIEAAAPVTPAFPAEVLPEPEHPHTPPPEPLAEASPTYEHPAETSPEHQPPLPIASSGETHMMPPATGLPTPRSGSASASSSSLAGVFDSIPQKADPAHEPASETAHDPIPVTGHEATESTHHA